LQIRASAVHKTAARIIYNTMTAELCADAERINAPAAIRIAATANERTLAGGNFAIVA